MRSRGTSIGGWLGVAALIVGVVACSESDSADSVCDLAAAQVAEGDYPGARSDDGLTNSNLKIQLDRYVERAKSWEPYAPAEVATDLALLATHFESSASHVPQDDAEVTTEALAEVFALDDQEYQGAHQRVVDWMRDECGPEAGLGLSGTN